MIVFDFVFQFVTPRHIKFCCMLIYSALWGLRVDPAVFHHAREGRVRCVTRSSLSTPVGARASSPFTLRESTVMLKDL